MQEIDTYMNMYNVSFCNFWLPVSILVLKSDDNNNNKILNKEKRTYVKMFTKTGTLTSA